MNKSPQVDVAIAIHKDCPITYLITRQATEAEFTFGPRHDFHYIFDAGSLRHFLQVGTQALAELEQTADAGEPATQHA